jgi:nucleoredoxin
MTTLSQLLGEKLLNKEETVSTADALAGKHVALYFSAHWCPPCRGFTPELAKMYVSHLKAKGLEIVFVSSDRDEAGFSSYYAEMPWLALPYGERELKAKLSKKYKVSGIPSLIILDESGNLITADGREAVSEDPTGAEFPWKPPSVFDALGDEFLSGTEGETQSLDDIKRYAKVIGMYFSAHWCPPCRGFTPSLVSAYKDHLKAKGLEIIFVSSDRDQKAFLEYYGSMPWLAIPQGDTREAKLSKLFSVDGIPAFVLIDAATGETITTEGRGAVGSDPKGDKFPWFPPAVNNLSEGEGVGSINDETALCVLLEGCSQATKDAALAALEPIATAKRAAKEELLFFYGPTDDGPASRIRELAKLGAATGTPQMVLLDIPDSGGFYVSDATEISADTITAFLEAFKAGALKRKQLGEEDEDEDA